MANFPKFFFRRNFPTLLYRWSLKSQEPPPDLFAFRPCSNSKLEPDSFLPLRLTSSSPLLSLLIYSTMSAFSPRRSARLNQDQARGLAPQSTPSFAFSQNSSTSTTSHPSPTNNGLNPPPSTPQNNSRQQAQNAFAMAQQPRLDAPLPSPSANEIPFFARPQAQPNPFQQPTQNPSYFQQQSQQDAYMQNQEQPPQLHPHSNSISQQHPRNVNSMAPQLPPDFLAEAAKRAQIACLMRDMGDVTL